MSRWRRPSLGAAVVLAVLAYVPALTAAPGRMPADSKLYLYLDPRRFLGDAASSFDPRQFAGWVPHQHIAYLWPAGPWYWVFDTLQVPDWIAHRLWIGSLLLLAGLGVRWCSGLLGLAGPAALAAAVVYQTSPYVLPYVSRTSVMLLPWAGLGWVVALTVLATRRRRWLEPAALALVVFTVGAVNATALAMIVPAPALWIVHAVWLRSITWRQALIVVVRVCVLTIPVCLWWMAMLVIQGRSGAEILPYSESLGDVSLTATGPEVWRSLGYWLFYIRDPYSAATTESLRYLSSSWSILVSYVVPLLGLVGLVVVRWPHRRFAALLVAAGGILAIGVHPIDDSAPLVKLLAGDDDSGLALALRSSTRALPVMNLGLALLIGALVAAIGERRWQGLRWPADRQRRIVAGVAILVAIVNLPSLWTGAFVDPALEHDQDPPAAWLDAASALDAGSGSASRVLQVPGSEFGAYRWGYTVDQPLPGLTDAPLVTRDLLPLGSAAAMDLMFALDDRFQDGVFEPDSMAPIARWLGADVVWVTNDLAFDRFRTARPQVVGAQLATGEGIGEPTGFGPIGLNQPQVPMVDERALGDPQATAPVVPVELYPVDQPGRVIRAGASVAVVSGSGDGLVDASAAGLLDGDEVVRYSASLDADQLVAVMNAGTPLIVTDSNRSRARQWRGSQDATGYTESDQPELALLRDVSSDQRLPVFAERDAPIDPATQTIARQVGPVTATATSYGEPFAYLPERRPFMAIDGDPTTAWTVGEHDDPIGETLRLRFAAAPGTLHVLQALRSGGRRITEIRIDVADPTLSVPTVVVALDDRSVEGVGQPVEIPGGARVVDLTITAVGGGDPATAGAVAGVGFAEITSSLGPTLEVVRPPHDALAEVTPETPLTLAFSRLRTDPMDRWRSDPEPVLVRQFELPDARPFDATATVRVDRRAGDAELASIFGWPAIASSRLTGSIANAGVAAIDGDPSTAWMTAFGEALGATLTITDVGQPIATIAVRQPVHGLTPITALTLSSGDQHRTVELVPDAAGVATATIEPPLPAGPLTVTIAAVEPTTTIDRRYADVVELPAAISELTIDGLPSVQSIAGSQATIECTELARIDDEPLTITATITGAAAIAGDPIGVELCNPLEPLAAGEHLVRAGDGVSAITLDRVVLSDAEVDADVAAASTAQAPTVRVLDNGKFDRSVSVERCADGCWLVFGEGFNPQWRAAIDGRDLGDPQLVDGGFNGWWLPGSNAAVTVDLHWTQQRPLAIALWASLLGVIAASAVIVVSLLRQRRRLDAGRIEETVHETQPESPEGQRVRLGFTPTLTTRRALVAGVVWVVASMLLVSPVWALAGLVGGAAIVVWRRSPIAELTVLATVAVVALLVVVGERRHSPAPNGRWPGQFEQWHGLAAWALATLLVVAIAAADDSSHT